MAVVPFGCGRTVAGLDIRTNSVGLSRSRRRPGHRQRFNAACDGDYHLWRRGLALRRRPHRAAETQALKQHSAAAPHAGHVRHDHRAARPVFLHIGCVAHPNRIGARIVARINTIVRLGLIAGIDSNPPRRTGRTSEGLCGCGLRGLRVPRRRLRFGARCQRTRRHQAY
jgi:hypothetical protein